MKKYSLCFLALIFCFSCKDAPKNLNTPTPSAIQEKTPQKRAEYAMAIHGGAGTILKKNMTPEKEAAYLAKLNEALDAGETILKSGGSAMDAVVATINVMEDSPLFNAGKGAVFTNHGTNELDASFMDGKTQNAGAVSGVTNVKNPINAARAVMEKSNHVMLSGTGAEQFAKEQGLEIVDPKYFWTERRWNSLEKAKAKEMQLGYHEQLEFNDWKYGTVGCAALDKDGNLAAGTSTGGMTNKRFNRIGDAPIIGAGCYANNNTCAISSTGHGEYFIRYAVAHDISARMAYLKEDLSTAAGHVVKKTLVDAGGTGGIISVDKYGNVAMPFNTSGMYRGYAKPGDRGVFIYEE
ncbi:MAG: isoaspartyl peptidase/L-asparaginase [Bacteroidota bacterium]